jgi:DNA-binding NtrC family response regulator
VDIDELEAVLSVGQDSPEYNPEWLSGEHPIASREGLVRPRAEQERDAIQDALVRTGGNQSKAARLLGVHRNTLLRRIRKLGIHIAT